MHRRSGSTLCASAQTTMRWNYGYLFATLLPLLSGCEGVDNYIGRTLKGHISEPTKRITVKAVPRLTRKAITPKLADNAKQNRLFQVPQGQIAVIRTAEARLSMSLDVFNGGSVVRRRFTSTDRRHVEEDAFWTGSENNPVSAGILLSESIGGPPITDGLDPAKMVDHWAVFSGKRRTFGDLISSKNALGPVLWRRSRVSGSTCVVFLQRWSHNPPAGPASTLSGFFCAAPGETLTPGEAETVVQSLGISTAKS